MSSVKKGQLTASGEWRKHLRKYYSREFWKKERKAAKADSAKQADCTRDGR